MRQPVRSLLIHLQKTAFLALLSLLVSCASLSPDGVGRVKRYLFAHETVQPAIDGYKIAFISDLHYPSLFNHKRLQKLVHKLQEESPDMLLLGGDYVTVNDSIDALFKSLSAVNATYGTYAVLGNHDVKNRELITESMNRYGIELLDGVAESILVENGFSGETGEFSIAGVSNSFAIDSMFAQCLEKVGGSGLVILLCHTPDFAERNSVAADLVLSGHTHGGQVSFFGLYTPVSNSRYGNRFLRGMNSTTVGSTVITTNGVGTSRRKVRFCVPSEIVIVTLRSKCDR